MLELRKLKGRMRENGVNGVQIAAMIGHNKDYVYAICNGRADPRLSEVYTICLALEIPLEEIPKYFPKEE